MSQLSTPAILIRRLDYGDFDLIVTFLTHRHGKVTAIAKSAKRSVKRFGGVLELFSLLDVVINVGGRGRGMPVLSEATLNTPVPNIRRDITKTAFASYWAELVNQSLEGGQEQTSLFRLLGFVLGALNAGEIPAEVLSILFQMRLLTISGLCPNLNYCCSCHSETGDSSQPKLNVDLSKGGVVCERCTPYSPGRPCLSKGTIKQLQWLNACELGKVGRMRFSPISLQESRVFLEDFVPYHLGKEPKSLKFLRRMRSQKEVACV